MPKRAARWGHSDSALRYEPGAERGSEHQASRGAVQFMLLSFPSLRCYRTVKLALVVTVRPGVVTVMGPVVAPAGTVAQTSATKQGEQSRAIRPKRRDLESK